MSAYIIFIRLGTRDQDRLGEYRKLTPAITAKHPITRLTGAASLVEALEGGPAEGVTLFEFPTLADARAFYESAEYQAASELRRQGGDYKVILVDGVG